MAQQPFKKRRTSYQVVEDASSGLSSEQIWSNLNVLLGMAAKPAFENTYLGADLLISLLSASIDRRRKVSTLAAEDCRAVLFYSLMFSGTHTIFDTLKDIGIERNLIFDPLLDSVSSGKMVSPLLASSVFDEDSLIQHVKQSLDYYSLFRSQVSMRYFRLADSMGKRNAWIKSRNGLMSDSGEHVNNYMLAVLRAIDKFYPHKGTLASYVESWMANAAGSSLAIYSGEAFSIPRAKRKSIAEGDDARNMAVSIDNALELEDTAVDAGANMEDIKLVQLLEHTLSLRDCRPAWLELEMPMFLTRRDAERLSNSPVISLDSSFYRNVANVEHIHAIPDNVNFSKVIRRVKAKK